MEASDFHTLALCVQTDWPYPFGSDSSYTPAGAALYYLVRVENDCPLSNDAMGADSSGVPRSGRSRL